MKVLVEGIGSMVFGPQLRYYNEAGWELVGIDITNKSFGLYKNIKPYIVPKYKDPECFRFIEEIIRREKIDLVFPTVDEGLMEWSARKGYFKDRYNTTVVLSDQRVIEICTDKWKTYNFFKDNGIPTPATSLEMKYDLLKPRMGRGSQGILHAKDAGPDFNM
ncbi:MAG TPA: ATP-grasp domain-containing protein, partial [Clostridiaceae bacterium]|nr:ATP-grasp domain-containing protein [Clostridiaceae bacterium]